MPLLSITGRRTKYFVQVLETVEPILDYIVHHEEGEFGGVICVADSKTGVPQLTCAFGSITTEECEEYTRFALEKAKRLATHPGHFTSTESRDMSTTPKRYGGAIRGRAFIFSFSGFKEEQEDEAAMLLLEMRLFDDDERDKVSLNLLGAARRNPYFTKLSSGVAN